MNNQMTAQEYKIRDIFSREDKEYRIPNYQRPYSWTRKQAEELFDDIIDAYNNRTNEYFLGSIITISNKDANIFEIIDGQQRIISLSLLLLAIKDYFEQNVHTLSKCNDIMFDIKNRLTNDSISSYNKNNTKIKVRTTDQSFYDSLIYHKIFQENNLTDSQLKILSNYNVFKDKISDINFDVQNMIQLYIYMTEKISIVLISTTNIESSFRIFDVLNSRGLALTTIDLLKSKIFEKVFLKYQEKIPELEQKWLLLEDRIGIDNLNGFYITHCLSKLEKHELLFSNSIERYEERLNNDPSVSNNPLIIVDELIRSAKNYNCLYNNLFNHADISQSLHILSYITRSSRKDSKISTYSTWIPPLLAIKNRMDEINESTDISLDNFKEFLKIYEIFFLQMMLLKYNKPQIQNAYGNLIANINKLEDFNTIKNNLINLLKNNEIYEILNKDFNVRTPSMNQVVKGLYLRINFNFSDEKYTLMDLPNLTIEHILPKKISNNYWNDRFNEHDHSLWLNKLGNLTLLNKNKNSSIQNSDFKSKKEIYSNETNSIFPLTRELINYNDWTPNDINKRHIYILNLSRKFLTQYK